jgi:hypothetical protein
MLTVLTVPEDTALYDLLGVRPNASEGENLATVPRRSNLLFAQSLFWYADDIKKAYRKKVRQVLRYIRCGCAYAFLTRPENTIQWVSVLIPYARPLI